MRNVETLIVDDWIHIQTCPHTMLRNVPIVSDRDRKDYLISRRWISWKIHPSVIVDHSLRKNPSWFGDRKQSKLSRQIDKRLSHGAKSQTRPTSMSIHNDLFGVRRAQRLQQSTAPVKSRWMGWSLWKCDWHRLHPKEWDRIHELQQAEQTKDSSSMILLIMCSVCLVQERTSWKPVIEHSVRGKS